jgi:hypothetical protein
MDDSFRRFVEECDTFQVRPLLSVHGLVCGGVIDTPPLGRVFNSVQTMVPLVPLSTRFSRLSGMSIQNNPL